MDKSKQALLQALTGQPIARTPVWLMRQAGRYLPEYQALRLKAPTFLDLCLTPALASEATLQPVRRYDVDAAILFADILLVPYALGRSLVFQDARGPKLDPVDSGAALNKLDWNPKKIESVFETVSLTKRKLSPKTAFIGFSGGLWSVACYMIDGDSRHGFPATLNALRQRPGFVQSILDILLAATKEYLLGQIQAGVQVVQIFDSWAGLLTGDDFLRWVVTPTNRLVDLLKKERPDIPIIGFPRGARDEDYQVYVRHTGVDALSIDDSISLDFAKDRLQPVKPLQGNVAPSVLLDGERVIRQEVDRVLSALGPRHIVNLGHGVLPKTPPDHVADFVKAVHAWKPG